LTQKGREIPRNPRIAVPWKRSNPRRKKKRVQVQSGEAITDGFYNPKRGGEANQAKRRIKKREKLTYNWVFLGSERISSSREEGKRVKLQG